MDKTEALYGMVAEFDSPGALLHAAEATRNAGYKRVDACSPFPIHGIDKALKIPGSKVPWLVLGGAFTGGIGALALQWWTSAIDYPIKIAGKPYLSLPAFVPVIFELTVLLSAFAAVFGMLALNGLPRLYHPAFNHSRFHKVTDDGFFLIIESEDPMFSRSTTRDFMAGLGGTHIEEVRG